MNTPHKFSAYFYKIPKSYKYKYSLYRGDIHKRYAIQSIKTLSIKTRYAFISSYDLEKTGRYGKKKLWYNFEYRKTGHFDLDLSKYYEQVSDTIRIWNAATLNVNTIGNKKYTVTYNESPEIPIIIPT